MYIPSAFYRRKALAALKTHWQPALLVALIVNLPTLLMQGFSVFTNNDPISRLESFIITASRDGVLTANALMQEVDSLLASSGFWTIRGLELLALLVTPCLALGMYKWLMDLIRGREEPVSGVFCRVKLFFRAIGLQLLIILKILLWTLPGIAVLVLTLLPVYQAKTVNDQVAALQQAMNLYLLPLLLMVIPGAMAALRYAMSEYILAEKPETKVLACVRRSKELMRNQKKNLFFLMVSFLLWYLLELIVSSLLPGVVSLVFQMLVSLALNVYMAASIAVFYLRLEYEAEKGAETDEAAPGGEQRPEELN